MELYDSREQVREKPGDLAQEGTLGLNTPKLLEEGEGDDLRVREFFEGLVASPFRIEPVVSVVYLAKQNGHSLFQEGQLWGKLSLGHLMLLWTGRSRMALVLPYKPRNTHLADFSPDPPLDPSLDPPLPELPAQAASTEAPAAPTPRRAPSRTNVLREILSFKSFSP